MNGHKPIGFVGCVQRTGDFAWANWDLNDNFASVLLEYSNYWKVADRIQTACIPFDVQDRYFDWMSAADDSTYIGGSGI